MISLSHAHRLTLLTRREAETLERLSEGLTIPEIAGSMRVSESTIKTHSQHVLEKLGARSQREAACIYLRQQSGIYS